MPIVKLAPLLLAAASIAGCDSTGPDAQPFDLATATGTYTVTLAVDQGSMGPSCPSLSLSLTAPRSWSATCALGRRFSGPVQIGGDELVLIDFNSPSGFGPITLYRIGGTEAHPTSSWQGFKCWVVQFGCEREHGRAFWRR